MAKIKVLSIMYIDVKWILLEDKNAIFESEDALFIVMTAYNLLYTFPDRFKVDYFLYSLFCDFGSQIVMDFSEYNKINSKKCSK